MSFSDAVRVTLVLDEKRLKGVVQVTQPVHSRARVFHLEVCALLCDSDRKVRHRRKAKQFFVVGEVDKRYLY